MLTWLLISLGTYFTAKSVTERAEQQATHLRRKARARYERGQYTRKQYLARLNVIETRRLARTRVWNVASIIASYGAGHSLSHLVWQHAPLYAATAYTAAVKPALAIATFAGADPIGAGAFVYGTYAGFGTGALARMRDWYESLPRAQPFWYSRVFGGAGAGHALMGGF